MQSRYCRVIILIVLSKLICGEKYELTCTEFGEQEILYDGYYCTIEELHLNYSDQVIFTNYEYVPTVRVVKFTDSKMPFIPQGIFRYLTNVREFDISFVNLETVHRDFEGAENLMYLTISHNRLTELPASLFHGAPNITSIDFSHNQIEKISKFTFVDGEYISRLDLSHNKLKRLDKELFEKLIHLDQINLDNNQLEEIDSDFFATNTLLQKVTLNNNDIVTLSCTLFSHSYYFNSLEVANNKISEFDTNCIKGPSLSFSINNNRLNTLKLRNVNAVDASNNNISMLTIDENTNDLTILKLANNSLSNLSAIFEHLNLLEHLDLSHNNIGRLNISTFSKLKNLKKLYLRNASINHLNFGTFASQKKLEVLDISYNHLNHINLDVFLPYLKDLESLYVDGNNLTEWIGLTHTIFPKLKILGISNNKFNCTHLAKIIRLLNLDILELTVDPEETTANRTHVYGIACYHDDSDGYYDGKSNGGIRNNITYHHITNHYDHKTEVQKAIIKLFYENILNSNNTNPDLSEQIKSFRYTNDIRTHQVVVLESNLNLMKYSIVFISIVCFIFVVAKLITLIQKHRRFNVIDSGVYHSTATMNTLQTNIAY